MKHIIIAIIGKSCSGKDTIKRLLMEDKSLNLHDVVLYTTRPLRDGECNGREYFFISKNEFGRKIDDGEFFEYNVYNVKQNTGETDTWYYGIATECFLEDVNNIIIASPNMINKLAKTFKDRLLIINIECDDETIVERAIQREENQNVPNFIEMSRRIEDDRIKFDVLNTILPKIDLMYNNVFTYMNGQDTVLKYLIQRIKFDINRFLSKNGEE